MIDLQVAKAHAKATLGMSWPGNLHDLTRWAELLVEQRNYRGNPYSLSLASRLSSKVNRIAANWREDLRYHANRPRPEELAATLQGVKWLFANESQLVR